MASSAGTASAGLVISTPTRLNPGDHFRILFITSGTTTATSSVISNYDTFVNTDANGATYNGSVISWKAIVSTPTVNAIDHIGVTGDAVYLVDGTEASSTDGTSGLWSGGLANPPNEYLDGTSPSAQIWTGTNSDGSGDGTHALGGSDPNDITIGYSALAAGDWIANDYATPSSTLNLYGISSDLVVPGATTVPEPSTAVLAALGALAGLTYSFARKRK